MPRIARFKLAPIEDLHRQLMYAPEETRLRFLDAAESLAVEIDRGQTYPLEFVVFRLTGYRPDEAGAPVTFVGGDLVADLLNVIQRLSVELDLPPDYDGRHPVTLDEVAQRLGVTPKTVQRYRQTGLVCHYVRFADGVKRLVCFDDALERFTKRHRGRLERAATFSRVEPEVEATILQSARTLREREQISLNAAARRLAKRHAGAVETMRRILQDHDARSETPIFAGDAAPLTQRQCRVLARAWRLGISGSWLAGRFGKAPVSVQRAINRQRVRQLKAIDLEYITLPTFDLADAERVILASRPVSTDLDDVPPDETAGRLIEAAHAAQQLDEETVDELVAGYNLLKRRATHWLREAPPWPTSAAVDRVETDLRWAGRLKMRLLGLALPVIVITIERGLHRPLLEQPADEIVRLLRIGIEEGSRTIETLDPGRGHHLEGRCAFELGRRLAGLDLDRTAERASARHDPGTVVFEPLLEQTSPWAWLSLPASWRARLDTLDPEVAVLVRAHYAIGPTPPRTLDELAQARGSTPSVITRQLQRAITDLRRRGASRS